MDLTKLKSYFKNDERTQNAFINQTFDTFELYEECSLSRIKNFSCSVVVSDGLGYADIYVSNSTDRISIYFDRVWEC